MIRGCSTPQQPFFSFYQLSFGSSILTIVICGLDFMLRVQWLVFLCVTRACLSNDCGMHYYCHFFLTPVLLPQACNRMSFICVPLYDTLGDDAVEYVMKHSEVSAVFVSKAKFGKLAEALPKLNGQVKAVVYWGGSDDAAVKVSSRRGRFAVAQMPPAVA